MTEIVESTMTDYKSDFYDWDKPFIESEACCTLPAIWVVGKLHTRMLKIGNYYEWFFNEESFRYAYAAGDDGFTWLFDSRCWDKSDKVFLITESDVCEITVDQAKSAIKDYVTPAVHEWIKLNGPLDKPKVHVNLHNITSTQLKAMVKECRDHNNDSLMSCLKRFHQYRQVAKHHVVDVYYNPGWNEFSFVERINGKEHLAGGIIFHGWPETGYQTNNSIQIDPHYGWSIHT